MDTRIMSYEYPIVDLQSFIKEFENLTVENSNEKLTFIINYSRNTFKISSEYFSEVLINANLEKVYFEDLIRKHLPQGYMFNYVTITTDNNIPISELEISRYQITPTAKRKLDSYTI